MDKTIEEYLGNNSWRIKANANHNRSFSGLQSHIAGTALAKHALGHLGKIGRKHLEGSYHLHNLEAGLQGRYCVSGFTNIQTPDGIKYANHIKVGDTLIGYNEKLERFEHTTVQKIFSRETDEIYELKLERPENFNVTLRITGNHNVLTNQGWKSVENLNIGDEILYLIPSRRNKAKKNKEPRTQEELSEIYRNASTPEQKESASKIFNKYWENKEKIIEERISSGQYERTSERMKLYNPMKNPEVAERSHTKTRNTIAKDGRVSKTQRKLYDIVKKIYPDAILEFPIKTSKTTRYIDVAIPSKKIALEYDGKPWHDSQERKESDKLRELEIRELGWNMLHFTNTKELLPENIETVLSSIIPENGAIVIEKKLLKPKKCDKRNYKFRVYNFECYPHQNYLANSMIVHNCNGNSALDLLQRGLINIGGVNAKPAKHFATCLDQISNFTYLMTGEFAGAQAWRDLDILLAPYIRKDNISYDVVKQDLQQFIWNVNFNMRPGFQTPFLNLSVGMRPSKYYENLPVLAGEVITDAHYTDYQDEIDLFNNAFFDILIESPDGISPFVFPMPTINITKDFKWDSEISNKIFELASKWGTPYFANYLNTDLTEEDALSMCCRLKINLKDVQKFSGGIWNYGANTGSLAVFTANMSRIGYMANGNDRKFYRILDSVLEDGRDYLIQKKEHIKDGSKKGLFPMTDVYVGEKLNKSYFLTVGHNGLNECSMNFCEKNIIENADWCEDVLKYMAKRTLEFQQQTGQLFNFEASPAEGCGFSLARLDREKFPDIFTQGTQDEPYYTGSSLIPMNIEIGLPDAIRHQEKLQRHYTGGTVFHVDTGEMASAKTVKNIIRNTLTNSTLPYVTWSPTYTDCPVHGKFQNGRGCECEKSETWSRVVGYYRQTHKFNIGRKKEFSEKKFLKI